MREAAVLMTVHNRRDKTLACLHDCYLQIDLLKGHGDIKFTVYMVDDGCTDGTSEAVSEAFPQTVIIKGDGNLYWNQGMRLAWATAASHRPDFYIWLNDDTLMREGALACLMETSTFLRNRAIVVATAAGKDGQITYGGRGKGGKLVNPDPVIPVPCWTFNGNLVLVPSYVYRMLGSLDVHYSHSFGDFDYGVRARKAGIVAVVAPGILCTCERDHGLPKWANARYPLRDRFAFLTSPLGRPPKEQFLYDCRSQNIAFAVLHFMSLLLKVLFPLRTR